MTPFERNFCHGHEGFRPLSHQASSGLTMTQIEIGEHSTKVRGLATTPGDNNGCDTKHSKPHHTKGDDGDGDNGRPTDEPARGPGSKVKENNGGRAQPQNATKP